MYPITGQVVPLGIPVKGLNARDPLAKMDPLYSPWVYNFEPESQYLRVRKGWELHANLTTIADSAKGILGYTETGLFVYTAKATENNKIWNVTTTTPAVVSSGGPTDDDDVTVQAAKFAKRAAFVTSTAGDDCASVVSGSSWSLWGFTYDPGTGAVALSTLVTASYRGRVYIFSGTDMYYSTLAAVTGATTKIDLSTLFVENASIVWAKTLTDATNKPTESMLVFGNSAGEILVYAGDNPGATNWELVARLKTAPPLNYNSVIEYNSDIWIATASGMVSLKRLFSLGVNAEVDDTSPSAAINPYWRQIVSQTASDAAIGTNWGAEQDFVASDSAAQDRVGTSVAIDDSFALVGATGTTTEQGSVYVLTNTAGTYAQSQELVASDAAGEDYFGFSVAFSGSTAVIGAFGAEAAYVFTEAGGTWTQSQILTASDAAAGDWFGYSVAIYGTTIVVGAIKAHNGTVADAGAAYVFKESGGTWTESQILTPSTPDTNGYFGNAVAMGANGIAVGAYYEDIGGISSPGAVYIYEGTSTYTQTQKLVASDTIADLLFGVSLSMDGNNLVIGSLLSPFRAYVFTYSSSAWSEKEILTPSDGGSGFGQSVSISGSYLIVGAYQTTNGTAYIFRNTGGSWNELTKLAASDGAADAQFGAAVSIYTDYAIVGAAQAAPAAAANAGKAYVFTRTVSVTYDWSLVPTKCSLAYWPEQNKIYVMLKGSLVDNTYSANGITIYIYNGYSGAWVPTVFTQAAGPIGLVYFKNNVYLLTSDSDDGRYIWKTRNEPYDDNTAGTATAFNYALESAYTDFGNSDRSKQITGVEPIIKTDFTGSSVEVRVRSDFGRKTSGASSNPLLYGYQIPFYSVGVNGVFSQYIMQGATDTSSTLGLELFNVGVAVK